MIKIAKLLINIIYVIIYASIIVFIDFKYLRYQFWKRLIVNKMILKSKITLVSDIVNLQVINHLQLLLFFKL